MKTAWTTARARRSLSAFAAVLTLATGALALPPAAAGDDVVTSPEQKREIAERLVIAGRQRMLAQGMAAHLCFADAGVAPEESVGELYVMWNVFGWYHAAIMSGNRELKLTAETDGDVQKAWHEVNTAWHSLAEIYEPVIHGATLSGADFDRAMAMTTDVTARATDVVTALRSAYSERLGPRGMGAALLVDLYERQRMLGQMIAKDVCLIARGESTAERLDGLARTIEIFSLSLQAFRNGRSDVGVPPPPTPEIAEALAKAQEHWDEVIAFATAASAGRAPERAELASFAVTMNRFTSAMTAAINELVSFQEGQPG